MARWFLVSSALAFVPPCALACASTPRPSLESPASPGASAAPELPSFTSLSASETPGLAYSDPPTPASTPPEAHSAAPDAAAAGSPPPRHHDAASTSTASAPSSSDTDPARLEREAFDRAHPVFVRFCADCHTTLGARHRPAMLRHFTMDGYPFGGHHAATIARTIREVLGAAGEPATMPDDRPGAVQGADLALVLQWAEAWDRMRSHPPTPAARSTERTRAPGAEPRSRRP